MTGEINIRAFAARRGRGTSQIRREPDGTRNIARQPKVPPKANQPGQTKVVVATRSTAGPGATRRLDRKRGELRPKGPTIQAERRRGGEAGHELWAGERKERIRAHKP